MIQVRVMRGICDCILGTDWCHFKMVGIRGIRNYPPDHFTLRARLLIFPLESGHHCGAGGLPAQMVALYRGIEEARR